MERPQALGRTAVQPVFPLFSCFVVAVVVFILSLERTQTVESRRVQHSGDVESGFVLKNARALDVVRVDQHMLPLLVLAVAGQEAGGQ